MTSGSEMDFYAVLGVDPDASAEEIREAYLARVRIAHPDRIDKHKSPRDWKKANEMLSELNQAYAVLRDSQSRSAYDGRRTAREQSTRRHRNSKAPDSTATHHGELTAGQARFADLPEHARARLICRQRDPNLDQFRIEIDSVVLNYAFLLLLSLWFVYLFCTANSAKWSTQLLVWYLSITIAIGILIGRTAVSIVEWSSCTLKSYFYVTPIYFIKTEYDIVSFRPLWSLTDIAVTHNFHNGSYQSTDLVLKFDGHHESVRVAPRSNAEALFDYMRSADTRVRAAFARGDEAFVKKHDDFAGVSRSWVPTEVSRSHVAKYATYAISSLVCMLGLAVAVIANSELAENHWVRHNDPVPAPVQAPPIGPVAAPVPVKKTVQFPEQPLPYTGVSRRFSVAEAVAPFEIRAAVGSHYLVKLVDSFTGLTALTVFVRSGTNANIEVPLGTYEVRYASGETWYGYEYLFGPDTSYSKADKKFSFQINGEHVSGFTLTLYKVPNGNLHTSAIKSTEF